MTGYGVGPIEATGAYFGDFRLTDELRPEDAPAVIEADRLLSTDRPGFERKLLPLRIEPDGGAVFGGGYYLMDTRENAAAYCEWEGEIIAARSYFQDVTTSVWHVVGAHDFKDVRQSQRVVRTEGWRLEGAGAADRVADDWARVRDEAQDAGRAAIWLLQDAEANRVATVTVSDRLSPASEGPDYASLRALGSAGSPGVPWERSDLVAEKVFDRTSWVFTVWFPTRAGGSFPEPAWPNSPPLPAPWPAIADAATS